jgi:hypothetical protein
MRSWRAASSPSWGAVPGRGCTRRCSTSCRTPIGFPRGGRTVDPSCRARRSAGRRAAVGDGRRRRGARRPRRSGSDGLVPAGARPCSRARSTSRRPGRPHRAPRRCGHPRRRSDSARHPLRRRRSRAGARQRRRAASRGAGDEPGLPRPIRRQRRRNSSRSPRPPSPASPMTISPRKRGSRRSSPTAWCTPIRPNAAQARRRQPSRRPVPPEIRRSWYASRRRW